MSSTEMHEIGKKERKSSSGSSHDSDVEKNSGAGDVPEETDDPEVQFIQPNHAEGDIKLHVGAPVVEFSGLTKEELLKFANDPFWKKVRWVLFILFWVLWAGMLIAAILIIVFTPKCPTIPKQSFWQKKSGYHVDVSAFKDTDGNGVGDMNGLTNKIDFLKTKGGFLVLSSMLKGSLGQSTVRSTAVTDFKAVDPLVGTQEDVKSFLKKCRQNNIKAVIEFIPHTGKEHAWFKKAAAGDKKYQEMYLWKASGSSTMVNRVGKSVWNNEGSAVYWSSLHKSLPALNVNNSAVLDELKMAVQFWLKEGFDGIFVDNAAFIAPEVDTKDAGKGLDVSALKTGDLKKWYGAGHTGQLHTDGSVKFIQEVRKWIDEIEKQTDRERLLLVSSGNTGLKQDREKTLAYLGDSATPGAHSVVLFDLVQSQGAKVVNPATTAGLLSKIDAVLGNTTGSITLITQPLSGPRVFDAALTSMNLLLPTTTLSLYGEEIGMVGYKTLEKTKLYPKPAYWYITQAAMKDEAYKDDLVDSYDVPMQWTASGGFSDYNVTKPMKFPDVNVMSLETVGRGQTRLDVFTKLTEIRSAHSLNWGTLDWIETQEKNKPFHYIFSRSAEGFPKFVIAIIRPTDTKGGLARDLSKGCEKSTAKLSYPSNAEFGEDVELNMKNIYLKFDKMGSLYVFKCKMEK